MANFRLASILITALVAVQAARQGSKPGMLSGTHSLGLVLPQLSGWGGGWNVPTTTSAPETTTGWSVETTTTTPETTTGWSVETTTTASTETTTGWSVETTTNSPVETTTTASPVETTTGWPAPTTTAPPTTAPGWPAPTSTAPPTTAPGWPAPPPPGWGPSVGWSVPTPLPVIIEMLGESAVVGEGEAGATHGSETSVSGDSTNPAVAIINVGSYSSLGQGSGLLQVSNINGNGESNTFQGIDAYNFGDAGEYYGGSISGNNINALNGGGSFVLGQGAIGQGGFTLNNNIPPVPFRN